MDKNLIKVWIDIGEKEDSPRVINHIATIVLKKSHLEGLQGAKLVELRKVVDEQYLFITSRLGKYYITHIDLSEDFPYEKSRILQHAYINELPIELVDVKLGRFLETVVFDLCSKVDKKFAFFDQLSMFPIVPRANKYAKDCICFQVIQPVHIEEMGKL